MERKVSMNGKGEKRDERKGARNGIRNEIEINCWNMAGDLPLEEI